MLERVRTLIGEALATERARVQLHLLGYADVTLLVVCNAPPELVKIAPEWAALRLWSRKSVIDPEITVVAYRYEKFAGDALADEPAK